MSKRKRKEQESNESSGRPTVVILDNHRDTLAKLSSVLSTKFEVVSALTPDEAHAHIEDKHPDAVVVDLYVRSRVNFGIEAGLDYVKELKGSEKFKHIPVVVYSKFGDFLNHPERYKDEPMYFPPSRKKYTYQELKGIKRELERLGVEVFSKFEKDEEDLLAVLESILQMQPKGGPQE